MVKLRVAARVIPESDYNGSSSTQLTERKFLVVVRNPEDWYIGTLAVEIQNTYKRIYKHDLGKIKYLKDADDFDLDTEQLVSDVFVNEGKADGDGLDQDATIKVVQEQGQAVRQGSVVPDLTPIHYQKPPLPPVPTFSEVPQTLGKRSHDLLNGRNISDYRYGGKRFRHAEIDETQHEDELIPSVERSPELIADTQTSQGHFRRGDIKLESPDLHRSFRDIAPANEDELELLPQAPSNFPNNRRSYVLGAEHLTPRTNGLLRNPATRSSAANRQSQLPITPPTDPAVKDPTPLQSATNRHTRGSRSPGLGALSTGGKFKPARPNLYEMAESDIEDSQMSPGKDALPIPRLVKKLSSIENMPSQEQSSYETFNAQAALDPMDVDEHENTTQAFIDGKRHSLSMHNNFGDRARKVAAKRKDASSEEVEIPATASDPKQGPSSQGADKKSQDSASTDGQPAPPNSQGPKRPTPEAKGIGQGQKSTGTDTSKSQASGEERSSKAEKKRVKNQRNKAAQLQRRREAEQREQGPKKSPLSGSNNSHSESTRRESTASASADKASTPSSGKRSIFDAGKKPRRSSQLDSPGEQLSQALQESARKPSLTEARSKLAIAERQDESRPSTSGSGSTNGDASTSTSRRSSSGTTESSPGRLGLGITNSRRKKKGEQSGKEQMKSSELTFPEKLKKAKEEGKSSAKEQKTSKASKVSAEDTPLPSVEKPKRKRKQAAKDEAPGGPINLEEQCGVKLNDGKLCGKALGGKCHAKSLQRAVPGRSRPLDAILADLKKPKELPVHDTKTSNHPDADNSIKNKVSPVDQGKIKDGESVKSNLPNWEADQDSATILRASAPEATPVAVKASSSRIFPAGMTEEEFERLTKASAAKPVDAKLLKKKVAKETPKPAPPPPKIKVSDEDGSESSSNSESESESGSDESGSGSEESESEDDEKVALVKTSTKQTHASKKAAKDDTKLQTPKPANLRRESTTPGSDFDDITHKLKSIKHTPGGPDANKLQPPAPKSTLKKKDTADRRSSAGSSQTPKPSIKKPTPSVASSSASKPAKPVPAKGDKGMLKATPQVATPTPKHETLVAMKLRLQAESREASKRASPAVGAKGLSLGNQGQKKVFDDSDESSSSESSSSSSGSEDSDDGKKAKTKKGGKSKGSPSAVPDRSIRDPTPDVDSSDEA